MLHQNQMKQKKKTMSKYVNIASINIMACQLHAPDGKTNMLLLHAFKLAVETKIFINWHFSKNNK